MNDINYVSGNYIIVKCDLGKFKTGIYYLSGNAGAFTKSIPIVIGR